MRIFFFNRFFYPDSSATSQILADLAFHLAERHEVHVVTSRVPGGEADNEIIRGVHVHRVATAITGPHSLGHRALSYAAYYVGARRATRNLVEPGDIVVAKTDPPMLSVAIGSLAQSRGAKFVIWLQDLFPEIAREYGIVGLRGPFGALLAELRNRSLAKADAVVAIGQRMAKLVSALGHVAVGHLHVIENWADGRQLAPLAEGGEWRRQRLKLGSKFVVGYSGNLGRVHEFDTLLSAAALLRSEPDIVFLITGRGPRLKETSARVAREALGNVRFEDHQPRDSLAQHMSIADVHLVSLQPKFEGLVVPSKLYGIMAVAKPAIFIGAPDGETAQAIEESASGFSVRCGDAQGLAAAILRLRDNRALRKELGTNARNAFDARYASSIAIARWEALLIGVHAQSRQ